MHSRTATAERSSQICGRNLPETWHQWGDMEEENSRNSKETSGDSFFIFVGIWEKLYCFVSYFCRLLRKPKKIDCNRYQLKYRHCRWNRKKGRKHGWELQGNLRFVLVTLMSLFKWARKIQYLLLHFFRMNWTSIVKVSNQMWENWNQDRVFAPCLRCRSSRKRWRNQNSWLNHCPRPPLHCPRPRLHHARPLQLHKLKTMNA